MCECDANTIVVVVFVSLSRTCSLRNYFTISEIEERRCHDVLRDGHLKTGCSRRSDFYILMLTVLA